MSYRTEGRDIIWDGWEKGIGASPYLGLGDMRNVNISGTPGEVSVGFKTYAQTYTKITNGTLVCTDSGDTVAHAQLTQGMAITVSNAGTSGLSTSTVYFVTTADAGVTFNLGLSYAATAKVTITGNSNATFSTINMGLPVSGCTERTVSGGISGARYYMVDSNGRAWVTQFSTYGSASYWTYLNNQTITDGYADVGMGIAAWKGYLFLFRRRYVAYVSTSLSVAPASTDWNYTWKTMNSNSTSYTESHYALVGQDDVLYFCDKDYIGSIMNVDGTTFDPTSAGTYIFNATALRLPSLEVAQCLGELGRTLLVGGSRNYVYPWDRISSTFSYPIMLPEQTTTRIVTANNVAYLFAGNRGRIYQTNGSSATVWANIPDALTGTNKPYFYWQDAMWHRNKIFFSFATTKNMTPATPLTLLGGVWSIDTETKALVCENQLSHGTYAGWATVLLSEYIPSRWGRATLEGVVGEGYLIGWFDGTNYGADGFYAPSDGSSYPYTAYEAYVDTEMTPVGQLLTPRTFENIEFKLGAPLVAGEKVKIQYRTDLSQAFADLSPTAECSTAGSISDVFTVSFENSQWLQFRILLSSTNTTPSFVRLRELRLR